MRRYTFLRQAEPGDGAAAALATVCLHHGLAVDPGQLQSLNGAGTAALVRVAETLGLTARVVKVGYDPLCELPLPAVTSLRDAAGREQFVVVYRADRSGVVLADPSRDGILSLSRADFCQRWGGRVVVLVRDDVPPAYAPAAPGQLATLWHGQLLLLLEALVWSLFLALVGVGAAAALRLWLDWAAGGGDAGMLPLLVLGLALLLGCGTLFGLAREALVLYLGRRAAVPLAQRYVRRLFRLPADFFEAHAAGDLAARLLDAARIRPLATALAGALLDLPVVLAALVLLWVVSPLAALVATVGIALLGSLVLGFTALTRAAARRAAADRGRLAARVGEDVGAVETYRGVAADRARGDDCEGHLFHWLGATAALDRSQFLARAATTVGVGAVLLVVAWVGGLAVAATALSVGQWGMCLALTWMALWPLRRLAAAQRDLVEGSAALDRLGEVLAAPAEEAGDRRKVQFQEFHQGIALENVSFAYAGRGKVFDGLSLTVPAGRTIAVVGPSGSGKTTLLRLLAGACRAAEGQVKVDTVDLRDLDRGSLRERVALVEQDAAIVRGTVAENVALGDPEAGLAEVTAALRAAGLEDFVDRLPQRHDTPLAERGRNLSAGQRQQLALARALLRQPRVLLLDDALSSLDPAAERALLDALRWAVPGRTLVLATHRLSSALNADWVYLLHQGRVLESGPHAHLVTANGHYAALWRAQTDPIQQPSLAITNLPNGVRPAQAGTPNR